MKYLPLKASYSENSQRLFIEVEYALSRIRKEAFSFSQDFIIESPCIKEHQLFFLLCITQW